MTTTFTNACLIDPEAGTDVLGSLTIHDGVIADASAKGKTIDCGGMCLAPGIVDIGVKVCEPGERHKESYRTAVRATRLGCGLAGKTRSLYPVRSDLAIRPARLSGMPKGGARLTGFAPSFWSNKSPV